MFKRSFFTAAVVALLALTPAHAQVVIGGGGVNNVSNAGSSTDNAAARFDGVTGKIIQNSGVIIDDSANVSGIGMLGISGAATFGNSLDVTSDITVGGTVDGRDIAADGSKLDTIATGADVTFTSLSAATNGQVGIGASGNANRILTVGAASGSQFVDFQGGNGAGEGPGFIWLANTTQLASFGREAAILGSGTSDDILINATGADSVKIAKSGTTRFDFDASLGTLTLSPLTGINQGLSITQTLSGTAGFQPYIPNRVTVNDGSTTQSVAFGSELHTTGTSIAGAKIGGLFATFVESTGTVGGNHNGVGGELRAEADVSPSASASEAGIYGGNSLGVLNDGATGWNIVTGQEVSAGAYGTANPLRRAGLVVNMLGDNQGSSDDAAILFTKISGDQGVESLLKISNAGGDFPVDSSGGIFSSASANSMAYGLDFSDITFSGNAIESSGFTLDGSGNVTISNPATLRLPAYTVATLPAAGTAGRVAYVTDATSPTYLGTLTGGGSVVTPVFDNGTNWVAH